MSVVWALVGFLVGWAVATLVIEWRRRRELRQLDIEDPKVFINGVDYSDMFHSAKLNYRPRK